MVKNIEAVVFDLDGVITDTAHYHYLAWKDLADQLGIPFDDRFNENLKGVSRIQSLELILVNGGRENDFSMLEKEELANKKNELYKQYISKLTPNNILPGISNFIADMKKEGMKIGIASVSKNASTVLKALEIDELFDYCADASKITNSKPDPEIFLTVCENLDADPTKSIGVEDAKVGIDAIKSAKMFAVGVGETLMKSDLIVSNTSELDWEEMKTQFSNWKSVTN